MHIERVYIGKLAPKAFFTFTSSSSSLRVQFSSTAFKHSFHNTSKTYFESSQPALTMSSSPTRSSSSTRSSSPTTSSSPTMSSSWEMLPCGHPAKMPLGTTGRHHQCDICKEESQLQELFDQELEHKRAIFGGNDGHGPIAPKRKDAGMVEQALCRRRVTRDAIAKAHYHERLQDLTGRYEYVTARERAAAAATAASSAATTTASSSRSNKRKRTDDDASEQPSVAYVRPAVKRPCPARDLWGYGVDDDALRELERDHRYDLMSVVALERVPQAVPAPTTAAPPAPGPSRPTAAASASAAAATTTTAVTPTTPSHLLLLLASVGQPPPPPPVVVVVVASRP